MFFAGILVGTLLGVALAYGLLSASGAIDRIEQSIHEADALRLAFLDDNLLSPIYNAVTRKWGIVTSGNKFLAVGDTLHEAITAAQQVLEKVNG